MIRFTQAVRFPLVSFLFLLLSRVTLGQISYDFALSPGPQVVDIQGQPLAYPFAGGLTAPQWSPIDFDNDGDEDLFCFERDGNQLLMFERTAAGWAFRPDWAAGWPEMANWALLRDYDCDGLPDLFTGFQNAVYVHRNLGGPGANFEEVAGPLLASWDFGSGPSDLPVVVLSIDKPAIVDMDGDGDLDIITFTETSTTLYAFKGNIACGLDFTCTNRCYGMVSEGAEDNTLFYGEAFECDFNVANPGLVSEEETDRAMDMAAESRTGLHAGGALTLLELDGSGRPDLLMSDRVYPTIAALLMEASPSGLDSVAFVDMAFPSLLSHSGPSDSVNCEAFPAGYPLDEDGDGDMDLVFSPNTTIEADDDRGVRLWHNVGTADAPEWAFVTDNWIQNGMIDVGRNAIPSFADLNGDGLMDFLVGNKERYEGIGNTPTALAWYRNVGTPESPSFAAVDMDAIDFGLNGIESAHPTTGDLDGDGDLDLIVGDELGLLHRYENTAGPGADPTWVLAELGMADDANATVDVGQFATPQLIDFNLDGLLDLVVGEKNGVLNLYLNTGSASAPEWSWATDNLGGIVVDNIFGINGYSVPCLFVDGAGCHMYVAGETGQIQDFGLWPAGSSDWGQALTEANASLAAGADIGTRAAATLADLNNDGLPELAVGVNTGGVRFFQGTGTHVAENVHLPPSSSILQVSPQPARPGQALRLTIPGGEYEISGTFGAWTLHDAQGRKINHGEWPAGQSECTISAPMNSGIFVITVSAGDVASSSGQNTTGTASKGVPVAKRIVIAP